jgi:DNA repair protein RadC
MDIRIRDFQGYPKQLKKKYCKFGIDHLMDSEVLELLLLFANPRQDVRTIAGDIICQFGDFQKVLDEPLENLVALPGMNADSAIILKLARDCSDFYLKQKAVNKYSVRCGLDLIKYCRMSMSGLSNEQFRVAFLNMQSEIIEIETLQEGTIDQSVVYPRKVIERALYHRAISLIFIHNHTSGNVKPSKADKDITDLLVAAASSVDIEVYDHLIIGRNEFFSFRDSGLIKGIPMSLSL